MDSSLQGLIKLLDDAESSDTVATSIRQPAWLRKALRPAVELGMVDGAIDATNHALIDRLEAFAQRRALDEHYRDHPEARPSLAEVALRLAQLDHSPLAEQPDVIAQSATEVLSQLPDADADDVLVWANGLVAHGRSAPRTP